MLPEVLPPELPTQKISASISYGTTQYILAMVKAGIFSAPGIFSHIQKRFRYRKMLKRDKNSNLGIELASFTDGPVYNRKK